MISDIQQLRNTQQKLRELEAHYEERKQDAASEIRNLTLQSLKKTINQLKEEVLLFQLHESHAASSSDAEVH